QAGSRVAANDLIDAIVEQLKRDGKFVLPGFGKFTVVKTKAYIGLNPSTGEKVKVKAGKTVRFKASPGLRRTITVRWPPWLGQFGGLAKLGSGYRQAANLSVPVAQYASSGVRPANVECG